MFYTVIDMLTNNTLHILLYFTECDEVVYVYLVYIYSKFARSHKFCQTMELHLDNLFMQIASIFTMKQIVSSPYYT